ncbi:DUF1775 domain-containing protein [Planosporangium mesophilum]|uniref:Membrane protein n=1 Tax=Planosporangium mesophilum TaxID=689768 RepID=A0A8J3X1E5_9ACTN|nr:DUF1775 domain-containing protein [Planosporangium mesophilum]NJC85292.1 DUF1775 domain-containing protein [Planosporangium mesophilum]GII23254.1 membrane protein [Planosporangium mesophilum]
MVGRWIRRAAVLAAVSAAVLALPTPGFAHVEVTADQAQAGAANVTVSFSAESESKTAGIASLRVVLPDGIRPDQVAWVSGPTGWTLTPGADGYTVAGPALPAGEDAKYAVKIAQLPAGATSLPFRTLQTYSDGHIDRWIEIPTPGQAEPDAPAPVLTLQPASVTSAAPTTLPATPTATAAGPNTPAAADPAAKQSGPSWPVIGIAGLLLAVAVIVTVAALRRRRGPATPQA